jgi:hypothetical protein
MNSRQVIDDFLSRHCHGKVSVFLGSLITYEFVRDLSLLGVDAHAEIHYLEELLAEEKLSNPDFKAGFGTVEEKLESAISQLMRKSEHMDFAIDYILRSKNIRVSAFVRKNLYNTPRPYVRRVDGSLRNEGELGVLSQKKIYLQALVFTAINAFDPEALRHIIGFSKTLELVPAESISDELKKRIVSKHYKEDYAGAFKEFVLTEKVESMPLEDYWKTFELGDWQATAQQADAFYIETVVRKAPDAFVETILRMGRVNIVSCNQFVLRMIQSGFDCFPGFIKGTCSPLAAYDALQKPRDYQAMLNLCITKIGLPGFKALITIVPLTEIVKHPRKKDLLNIVHELTGSTEAVKLMDNKWRGKSLEDRLGL